MQTLKNQVILVTDATDGLGRRVARDLAALEATILLHERSREVFPKDCQKAYDLGVALSKNQIRAFPECLLGSGVKSMFDL